MVVAIALLPMNGNFHFRYPKGSGFGVVPLNSSAQLTPPSRALKFAAVKFIYIFAMAAPLCKKADGWREEEDDSATVS